MALVVTAIWWCLAYCLWGERDAKGSLPRLTKRTALGDR